MQFNPVTKSLYTDKGEFIKKMHCPHNVTWETLVGDKSENLRHCNKCGNKIYDAVYLTDDEALDMARLNPTVCFKLDEKQLNLQKVSPHEQFK